ncbi:MAG: UvrD-helicase domain-containing protein [Clostridia bacterium]|nr:UvrD-helicase domain-containing protein [Clostridia bacterium]
MGAINWTKEQLDVINSVDTNTLVSASAGSGKTAVMIERVVRIITGENGKVKTPLKRIIMVTFNESVASELKSKISAQLAKRLATSEDKDYLRQQIEDVPIADISTVHSLCSMIIKSNFEYLGIQPSFTIVDDSEKQTLFGKAISNVMKEYRENYDYQVDILINYLGGEKRFCDTLSRLYGFLEAQLDREAYLEEVALSNYNGDFKESPLAKRYLAELHGDIFELIRQGQDWQTLFESSDLNKHFEHVGQIIAFLNDLYATKDIAQLADAVKYSPKLADTPQLPKDKKDEYAERQESYKAYKATVKSLMDKLKKLFPIPYAQMQAELDGNKAYLTLLLNLLKKVYCEYSALKRKDNKMDFADLEYYAVKAMQDDAIAKELADSYDYICVDEYQDVNAVQEYVLTRLSNGKNLFMVGDVKQSIYQFRMTDPRIFLNKYRLYKQRPQDGSSFSLNSNYRSCREVIDFVNAIFDVVMKEDMGGIDYKKESRLLQGNLSYDVQSDMPIRIAHFPKEQKELELPSFQDGVYSVRADAQEGRTYSSQEGRYIAQQIKSLVGKKQIQVSTSDGAMAYRTVRYSDITLLCSTRSANVASIVEELRSAGIPVDSANIINEKKNSCVSLFTSFVRVVDNCRQDLPLTEILTSKVFADFSYKDLATIKTAYRKEEFFHQAVYKYCQEQDDALALRLKEFFAMLGKYRRISSFMGVDKLLRKLIEDFNYHEYMTAVEDGASEFVGLESFIQSLESKPYNAGISKFIEAVDNTADFGKVSGEAGREGDCVVTNTIHSSKGLEYPIVFIIDASKEVNLIDLNSSNILYDKTYGVALKNVEEQDRLYDDSLPLLLLRDVKVKETVEEKMRLFYVATTRARNMLYITATGGLGRSKGENKKPFGEKKISNPLSMIDWLNNVAVENKTFLDKYYDKDATVVDSCIAEQAQDIRKRKLVDLSDADAFSKELRKHYAYEPSTSLLVKHTVTAVNNDYYNSLTDGSNIGQDSEDILDTFKDGEFTDEEVENKRNSADEGVAYHRVLECIDYNCYTLDDVLLQLDNMAEQGLLSQEQRSFIDPKSILECLQSEVMQMARKYPHYREKQFMLNLPAREFLQVDCDDKALLQGTIDLFIYGGKSGGENILVDFKFSHKSDEQLKKRYLRQLELYAVAIEECLGIKVDKKIIFVLGRNRTVILTENGKI